MRAKLENKTLLSNRSPTSTTERAGHVARVHSQMRDTTQVDTMATRRPPGPQEVLSYGNSWFYVPSCYRPQACSAVQLRRLGKPTRSLHPSGAQPCWISLIQLQ